MQLHASCHNTVWSLPKKIIFRFFFILAALIILPFSWIAEFTGLSFIETAFSYVMDGMVNFFNDHLFHIKKVLVPVNGSGDTSYGWAQVSMFLLLSALGSFVWSILDTKRKNYEKLDYIICVCTRYFIALIAFAYGIIKIFALQMVFPSLTQMATPLGDYLPMRFSWLFIGYSTPYQVFSGVMECLVGLLLLYRRTATAGTIMAVIVFFNVMMLNLSYDIPVKIFSMEVVFLSLFLLAHEYDRIRAFFIMNREAAQCNLYAVTFPKKWMRVTRIVLKSIFIFVAVGATIFESYGRFNTYSKPKEETIIQSGLYEVEYLPTGDTVALSKQWKDFIIEKGKWGTLKMNSDDTAFYDRYHRAKFEYEIDSAKNNMKFFGRASDSIPMFTLHYLVKDTTGYLLTGRINSDSVAIMLRRSSHKFQLAEKQFHWLSEANR